MPCPRTLPSANFDLDVADSSAPRPRCHFHEPQTQGTKDERESARKKLKSHLLEESEKSASPGSEYFRGFYPLAQMIDRTPNKAHARFSGFDSNGRRQSGHHKDLRISMSPRLRRTSTATPDMPLRIRKSAEASPNRKFSMRTSSRFKGRQGFAN